MRKPSTTFLKLSILSSKSAKTVVTVSNRQNSRISTAPQGRSSAVVQFPGGYVAEIHSVVSSAIH